MEKEYPWYKIVDGNDSLLQGDFINECPVLIPTTEISEDVTEVEANIKTFNVLVMSQSCDLKYKKIHLVLVCPIFPFKELQEKNDYYKGTKGIEALKRDYITGYHLLDKCELDGFQKDCLIVDFHNVYGVPFDFIIDLAKKRGKRLRLLPPYREHLSQAFARFFMRVGLPIEIEL